MNILRNIYVVSNLILATKFSIEICIQEPYLLWHGLGYPLLVLLIKNVPVLNYAICNEGV
jgi:hypothetical protein